MSNKINIRHESSEYRPTVRWESLKKLGKRTVTAAGVGVAGTMLAVGGAQVVDAVNGPEFSGSKKVTVQQGDRLDSLINEEVEGGASYTGATRAEVKNDPDNADVFENGQLDPGEELELPEKVTD